MRRSFSTHAAAALDCVYIPAKMTAYLQPCETHVFAKFEHAFRKLWRERRSLSPDGAISMRAWMQVVSSAIQQILTRTCWRELFQMGCWRGSRGCLHGYVLCWSLMMLLICLVSHHLQRKLCAYSPNAWNWTCSPISLWQPKRVWAKHAQASLAEPLNSGSLEVLPWGRRRVLPASFKEAPAKRRVPRTID